jgi:transcriptional regulator with XRE-family HTH domain
MSTTRPPHTTNVVETITTWQPRRTLPPDLAEAVRDAKRTSRLSWREIAGRTGLSHSHLVLVAQGARLPSREVVDAIARVLPIEAEIVNELRDVAAMRAPAPPGRARGRVIR